MRHDSVLGIQVMSPKSRILAQTTSADRPIVVSARAKAIVVLLPGCVPGTDRRRCCKVRQLGAS